MGELHIGSLFSGYGGLDMGVQAAIGGDVTWHAEVDPYASALLAARTGLPNLGDVTTVDWRHVAPVDVLCGGYPCQPFSVAGQRKGSDDERHLWPYFASAIGALRPGLVVLENVAGHVSLGLADVLADLAELRYDARWAVVRASDAGAPHHRARVFIVATPSDADHLGLQEHWRPGTVQQELADGEHLRDAAGADGVTSDGAAGALRLRVPPAGGSGDAGVLRLSTEPETAGPGRPGARRPVRPPVDDWGPYESVIRRWETVVGRPSPKPTMGRRNGGKLSPAWVEWLMGLPHGWVTGALPDDGDMFGLGRPLPRIQQLRLLGNGVVPQQAALALRLLLPRLEAP